MIPKIIHTCWINKHTNTLSALIANNIRLFHTLFPEYTIKQWSFDTFKQEFPEYTYITESYNYGYIANVIDAMKLIILNKYGGLWIDANTIITDSILDYLPEKTFYTNNSMFLCGVSSEDINMFEKFCLLLKDLSFILKNGLINSENIQAFVLNHFKKAEKLLLSKNIFRHTTLSNGRGMSIIIPITHTMDVNSYISDLINKLLNNMWYDIIIANIKCYNNLLNIKYNNVVILNKRYDSVGDFLNDALLFTNADMSLIIKDYVSLCDNVKNIAYEEFNRQNCDMLIFDSNENTTFTNLSDIINYKSSFDTVVIRNSLKHLLQYLIEPYYENIEMYKFSMHLFNYGYSVKTININISVNKLMHVEKEYVNRMNKVFYDSGENSEMTAVLAFINEKTEVERTISSLRYSANSIKVLLVDDCSDDGFDYKHVADLYNCKYIKNPVRSGSVGGKHLGGMSVDTPYFCFFDAHMRVWKKDWDLFGIELLKQHPKSIISSRTSYLTLESNKKYIVNEAGYEGGSFEGLSACCSIFMKDGMSFDPKWTNTFIDNNPNNEISPVACVLGATYLIPTDWWKTINGFSGFHIYGLEEPYISIKTWLLGGECFVTKHWSVGHLYRDENPAPVSGNYIDANRYFMIKLFLDENELNIKLEELKKRIGDYNYKEVLSIFKLHENEFNDMKKLLSENKEKSIDWFFENINDLVNK